MKNGESERGSLAGAGLGTSENIPAPQGVGDRFGLYRGGDGISLGYQGAENRLGKLKLNELHENSPSKKVQMVDDAHHKGHGRRRRRPVDALQLDSEINQEAAKKGGVS
jgi:hypothetical protein